MEGFFLWAVTASTTQEFKQVAEKVLCHCHSERSEESLFEKCQKQGRFFVASLLAITHWMTLSASR
jgi:hypothetical protein